MSDPVETVTRFEVIDHTIDPSDQETTRRAFVKYGVKIELSYQDDGRTLKVFVNKRECPE